MIHKVVIYPDPKLVKPCEEVQEFDTKLRQLVIDLHQTMQHFDEGNGPDAAGLAAPQIGVMKRVLVYKLDGEPTCMINPKILEKSNETSIEPEGCLSFPGVYISIKRYKEILVEFQDVDGRVNQLKANGFTARCIQHEIDHLDGKTYIQEMSKVKKDIITRKMKKAQKNVQQLQRRIRKNNSDIKKQIKAN